MRKVPFPPLPFVALDVYKRQAISCVETSRAALSISFSLLNESSVRAVSYTHLGNTQADGLFDHIVGDAGAAVQHKGNVIRRVVDLLQRVEVQITPARAIREDWAMRA